jgi:hypothetical protein
MEELLLLLSTDAGTLTHATEIRSDARVRSPTSPHVKAASIFTCFIVECESINSSEA